jgi:ferredoxin
MSRGCVPVAGAAYIGEHSFSVQGISVALGRPDDQDLAHARTFGTKIREKLRSFSTISQMPELHVPGSLPYGGIARLWDVDFIAVNDRCLQCGDCAEVCPVGAIDSQDSALIDNQRCVTCCACVKSCRQSARSIKPGPVAVAQKRLETLYSEPKQPECFL